MNLGYKQSPVDMIPQGWEFVTLASIASFHKGRGLSKSVISENGTERCIHYGELFTQYGVSIYETFSRTNPINNCVRSIPNDVLMPTSDVTPRGLAKASCVLIDNVILGGDILIIRPDNIRLSGTFLSYLIRWSERQVLQLVTGTTVYHLYASEMGKFHFALPPLIEQKIIAKTLEDVDALLTALDRVIIKKKNLKKAAMQQLLSGNTRLPGFSDPWVEKQLGEICTLKSGDGITSESINDYSQFPCYGGNGLRGFTDRFTHDGQYCLIGRVGALCGNLLYVSGKFFASEHAIVVNAFNNIDVCWLTLALSTLKLNSRSESSAQPVLTVSKLYPLKLYLPSSKEEQNAIAMFISDMDSELAALQTRIDKTKDLKKAIIQDLLTGKTRLFNEEFTNA